MINNSFEELSEERQKEICECEDNKCGYYPLKHFEKCPQCGSKAFHCYNIIRNKVKDIELIKLEDKQMEEESELTNEEMKEEDKFQEELDKELS